MNEELKNAVKGKPEHKPVYLNAEGEWLFSKAPGFDKATTVGEILGAKQAAKPSEEGNKEEVKESKPKKK